MLRWMSDVSNSGTGADHIIGGQIWYVKKGLNIEKIKNLLNIIGKIHTKQ